MVSNLKSVLRILVLFAICTSLVVSHSLESKAQDTLETKNVETHIKPQAGGLTNVLVGYGLVLFGVGLSTLGALTLYLDPILVSLKLVDPEFKISEYEPFLAFTLAYSGGVLLATIFLDLLVEGFQNFESSNLFPNYNSKLLASSYFIIWMLLIMVTKSFFRGRGHSHHSSHRIHNHSESTYEPMDEYELNSETKNTIYEKDEINSSQTTLHLEGESFKVGDTNSTTNLISDSTTNENLSADNRNVGYEIAVALAIHNFPEGVVTFLAAYQSVKGGILFGIALALHKFPEGLMIGIPIVLSTKSKFNAVLITFCASFFTQILGATIAYLVSKYFWNDIIAALLFLLAAALLTITLFDGIMPLAKSKDKNDKYFIPGVILGISSFLILNSILEG